MAKLPPLALASTLLLSTLPAPGCSDPEPTVNPEQAFRGAKVDLSQAIAAARDKVPNGAVIDAEFEVGRDGPIYEVEILHGKQVYELYVDPDSGEVLRHEPEVDIKTGVVAEELDEAQAALEQLKRTQVSFADAIATAERELGGRAFEAGIAEHGYQVVVLTEQGPHVALISFINGTVEATREAESGPDFEADEDEDDDIEDEDDRL